MNSIADWVLAPGHDRPEPFVDALMGRLIEAGVPLLRCTTSLLTHHPEIFVRSIVWTRGEPARAFERHHSMAQTPGYLESPIKPIHDGAPMIRCRLEPGVEPPYPTLEDLIEQGVNDYLILKLPFSSGRNCHISFATDRHGGFEDSHLELLQSLVPALTVRIELFSAYFATAGLLRTYLGPEAAKRVGRGEVRRGTGRELEAAIWYCDMRNFTVLGDSRRPAEVVELLDQYFDAVAGPIENQGGEILKFIGDAVLAIFQFDDGGPCEAARRAVASARAGLGGLAALNAQLAEHGHAPVGVGIALHLGKLLYGNIGTRQRLDFTAIGATVNEAARIEGLCKELGSPILASRRFVDALQQEGFASVGQHSLKGVAAPMELFRSAP